MLIFYFIAISYGQIRHSLLPVNCLVKFVLQMIPIAFEASVGIKNETDRFFEIYFLDEAKSAVTKCETILRLKYHVASLVSGTQMSGFL